MSSTIIATSTPAAADPAAQALPTVRPMSPNQRALARFKRNRLGYVSLWLFLVILLTASFGEVFSNDKPFVARLDGQWWFPVANNPPERALGGDFHTPTDWKDPFTKALVDKPGNFSVGTLNPHSATSIDYHARKPAPSAPDAKNWLGTDRKGQDMIARLLFGFRVSIWFAIALTLAGTLLG